MNFSAVIVTRGDVDLGPVIAPIVPFADELVIRRGHAGVYERWQAILTAHHDMVYTQDDDAIVELEGMLAQIKGKRASAEVNHIICNMPADRRPEYQDGTALVGWGALVPKRLVLAALIRYRRHFDIDELFLRECDRAITGLSKLELVDVPFRHAPWANGPGRMCTVAGDPRHAEARAAMRARIQIIRGSLRSLQEVTERCKACGGAIGFEGASPMIKCPECGR